MLAVGLKKGIKGVTSFEVEKPQIEQPNQVLVRVIQAGIDGTDHSIVKNNLFDPPLGQEYMILGHEAIGVVEEVGKEVKHLKVGDMVVPTVRRGCGLCASCLHGESDMCSTGLYTERGIRRKDGFFTEYFVDEEEYIVPVPAGLEKYGVLTEPISIAEKAIAEIRYIQNRLPWSCIHPDHRYETSGWGSCKTALVIGAGPLGFMLTALLRMQGVHTYVAEIVPEESIKIQLIKAMGAHYINVANIDKREIAKLTGSLDIVIEASGASELALNLITILGRNGIFVLTGIPLGAKQMCLDGHLLLRQMVSFNQVVIGSVNSNRTHFIAALKDIGRLRKTFGPPFARLITHRFRLEQYQEAFRVSSADSLKVVFDISSFPENVVKT
jgi:threonine dehydrogenase-like Zn-dependent dehydrogenase